MSLRPSIPAVEGVADRQVAGILGAVKTIIDAITGREPNRPQIKALGATASQGAILNKVNEIIARLQGTDTATPTPAMASAASTSGLAKFWVNYTSVTTTTILASFNVSSLTDAGVGTTVVNFITTFSTANWATFSFANDNGSGAGSLVISEGKSASSVTALTITPSTLAAADASDVSVGGFGAQ